MNPVKNSNHSEADETLNHVFSALADPIRRSTINRLTKGPASVGELSAPHNISAAAFSKHLKVLQRAGLVKKELDGRRHRCSLRTGGIKGISQWVQRHEALWNHALDEIDLIVEQSNKRKTMKKS